MDTFIDIKNIKDTKTIGLIRRLIKCQTKKFIIGQVNYDINTFTINLPRNKFEDDIYIENPELLEILPRACSILMSNNKFVCLMEGPTKFSGRTDIDEDPDEGQDESSVKTIYNHQTIVQWASDKQLEIVETEKANGKFAIVKFVNVEGKYIVMCGSKNFHIVSGIDSNSIDESIQKYNSNDIIVSILSDIKTNLVKLMSDPILDLYNQGYSLVGELCDGQHFTDGDNTISWFGFFQNGNSMETMQGLTLLNKLDIQTVPFKLVFDTNSPCEQLDQTFLNARCKNNEGAVLRCRNIQTNQTILVKTKSVCYIVKRFMREIIKKGYKEIQSIQKRFIQAQKYHGLDTNASIRVTKQLIDFGFWLMTKQYPCSVLGHQPVSSVRGSLPNGFNTYWKQFIQETSTNEIVIGPGDFGLFDETIYLANTQLYPNRSYADPAIVVFIQGLQGSGKSTVADWVCKYLQSQQKINAQYIEQDMFWGDTNGCQGALYHMIMNKMGPKVVLVSRCNANEKQYKRYLEIISKLPCVVTFATPEQIDPLYLMVSLSGIINRSNLGDKLMVGRFEIPIEQVVMFTMDNYKNFVPATQTNTFQTHKIDPVLSEESVKALVNGPEHIIKFVQSNYILLNNLRVPVETIGTKIVEIIMGLTNNTNNTNPHIVTPTNPIYIGMAVNDTDKKFLLEFVNKYYMGNVSNDPSISYTDYIHHCTQVFIGPKGKIPTDYQLIQPGQTVCAEIDALVIRKKDMASAFRINNVSLNTPNQPHITARIPINEKPMCSNSFVGLNDSTVTIIDFHYKLNLTGFWA